MSHKSTPPLREKMLEAIEEDLKSSIQILDPERYPELTYMIRFHMGWTDVDHSRGKRIRPLLVLLCCAGAGADWRRALPAASAVEWIHSFSLVHDDIEDQSETRRGRPTLWIRWGIAQAINSGDSMFTLARLTSNRLVEFGVSHKTAHGAQHILDRACLQLTQGQHLDLSFENNDRVSLSDYLLMVEGKTCALLSAATSVGAYIAESSSEKIESYRLFGHHLGLAFQIQDDILGIWGQPDLMGKPSGDDLRWRKKTLPTIYGMENSPTFSDLFLQDTDQVSFEELLSALDQVNALDYAKSVALYHTDLALKALNEAEPHNPAGEELVQLTYQLSRRQF